MKTRLFNPGCLTVVLLTFLVGSMVGSQGGVVPGNNVYSAAGILPTSIKRVLLLPVAYEHSAPDLLDGCSMLDPVVKAELIKTARFEVVVASAETLETLTGQPTWNGTEELPPSFFGSLKDHYGCDAILFCQLTTFHAYPPISVGWRFKLVDLSSQTIIWADDTVFDAGDPAVSKGAEDYERVQRGTVKSQTFFRHMWSWLNRQPQPVSDDPWTVLNSPRYFGEYTVYTVFGTLPKR